MNSSGCVVDVEGNGLRLRLNRDQLWIIEHFVHSSEYVMESHLTEAGPFHVGVAHSYLKAIHQEEPDVFVRRFRCGRVDLLYGPTAMLNLNNTHSTAIVQLDQDGIDEPVTVLSDSENLVFVNHKGLCLYVKRSQLIPMRPPVKVKTKKSDKTPPASGPKPLLRQMSLQTCYDSDESCDMPF